MAARSVIKLLAKTYTYSLNAPYSSNITSLSSEKSLRPQQTRSCSQPPQKNISSPRECFHQLRTVSKSLENFKESRYRDEDYEENETEEEQIIRRNAFPTNVSMSIREPAREFKDPPLPEETNEEGNPVYELGESSKSEQTFYDVIGTIRRKERERASKLFMHLQPQNIRPYGSTDTLHFPHMNNPRIKIYYPVVNSTSSGDLYTKKKINEYQRKEYSSYGSQKEYPLYEENTKVAVCNSNQELNQMKYTTTPWKKRSQPLELKKSKLQISKSFTRRSSTALFQKPKDEKKNAKLSESSTTLPKVHKTFQSQSQNFDNLIVNLPAQSRNYNNQKPQEKEEGEYVTVKLGELKEQCRKEKKCKPLKKLAIGRLPQLIPPDCPCLEQVALKEGRPISRLKKRHVKEPERVCSAVEICDKTLRADANLKVVPKTLPKIKVQDCPCEEVEMTDFVIRRLPKKKFEDPPKKLICAKLDECPPRADASLVVKKKSLPKLELNQCPCIEHITLEDVPLKRLTPKEVKEPEKICIEEVCEPNLRADYGLKVKRKTLPAIKGDCPCIEPFFLKEGKPFPKLKKVKVPEKKRICLKEAECDSTLRADANLKIQKKRLPRFVPQECPCKEEDLPSLDFKLKRLTPRSVPKEKKIVCKVEVCPPRADDGMKVVPKQLPKIQPKECPCVEVQMIDPPPLKKLKAKPVKEPEKICQAEVVCTMAQRSDAHLKVEGKSLPPLPPGSCPCVEPPIPEDVKPLKKLKKRKIVQKRVCPQLEDMCAARADENLKVELKKLPKLEIMDCPCIEATPPVDVKPLPRLKKKPVPEPVRICKTDDICEEATRADSDDWLYWKRVEVKPTENKPVKGSKRSFSTFSKRLYSTGLPADTDSISLKYDVSCLFSKVFRDKASSIRVDVTPLDHLDLAHRSLKIKNRNSVEGFCPNEMQNSLNLKRRNKSDSTIFHNKTARSKFEPVDCVTVVINKNKFGNGQMVKEALGDASFNLDTSKRCISTCSTLCEYSERNKNKKDHQTPLCECPPPDDYLQPRNPIIPEKEMFVRPWPSDEDIYENAKKGRMFERTRKDQAEGTQACSDEEGKSKESSLEVLCLEEAKKKKQEQKLGLWERFVNYFKARDCPSPDEFKKMRLREEAEKAASKAGLCLYDPKELLRRNKETMPKVITADTAKEEISK